MLHLRCVKYLYLIVLIRISTKNGGCQGCSGGLHAIIEHTTFAGFDLLLLLPQSTCHKFTRFIDLIRRVELNSKI